MPLEILENRGLLPMPAFNGDYSWRPINSAQLTFLECRAQMALFGGASGGGKTEVLVADAVQEYANPKFRGVLLRKSFSEMTAIIDTIEKICQPLGVRRSDGGRLWRFPSGAQLRLGYMSSDKDVELYTGKPISWLGIDEAQFQDESRIRKLLPWVATPREYGLKDRVRMSANPSTPWLKQVFLNGECPVCHPERSVIPGAVYAGARWKKDQELTMLTTAFVPARVSDNPLYDERKMAVLLSQSADVRKKLLDGCWCSTEGAFFPFLNDSYILPYSECGEEWWHPHFISMDYGYSNSAAATGLYFVNDRGIIFKVQELVSRTMYSEDYARAVLRSMCEREIGGKRIRLVTGFADPAMDAHTGTGQSNLDIINGVLADADLYLRKAAKDSIGNAQVLSGKLSRREYILTDMVPKTYESLTSRKNDPDRPGAILKIKGDELDDVLDTDLYGINTFLQGASKPTEIENEERINRMVEAGADQRSIQVALWRLQQSEKKTQVLPAMGKATIGRFRVGR